MAYTKVGYWAKDGLWENDTDGWKLPYIGDKIPPLPKLPSIPPIPPMPAWPAELPLPTPAGGDDWDKFLKGWVKKEKKKKEKKREDKEKKVKKKKARKKTKKAPPPIPHDDTIYEREV